MLNQTTFAKLLNNLKKISTSNMEEKTRGGVPYVINIAGGNCKLEIILPPFTAGKVRGTTKQIPQ